MKCSGFWAPLSKPPGAVPGSGTRSCTRLQAPSIKLSKATSPRSCFLGSYSGNHSKQGFLDILGMGCEQETSEVSSCLRLLFFHGHTHLWLLLLTLFLTPPYPNRALPFQNRGFACPVLCTENTFSLTPGEWLSLQLPTKVFFWWMPKLNPAAHVWPFPSLFPFLIYAAKSERNSEMIVLLIKLII